MDLLVQLAVLQPVEVECVRSMMLKWSYVLHFRQRPLMMLNG
jgi:hypothetical protein